MKTVKNKMKTLGASLLAVATIVVSGCSDNFTSPTAPAGSTIAEVASVNDSLKAFVAAINVTGLGSNLGNINGGQFTAFAPSNYAFIKYLRLQGVTIAKTSASTSGDMAVAVINALTTTSTPTIAAVITRINYHIISSSLPSTLITGAQGFVTMQGARLSLSIGTATPFVINANTAANGANITDNGTVATNGVIYAIDKVMTPIASNNIWIASLLNFSIDYTKTPTVVSIGGVAMGRDNANNYNVATAPTD